MLTILRGVMLILSGMLLNTAIGDDPAAGGGQLKIIGTHQKKPQPGSIRYKSGLVLSGLCSSETQLNPDFPGTALEMRMVDQGARQIFASNRQAEVPVIDESQWPVLTFTIPQKNKSRSALPQGFPVMGPFDGDGIANGIIHLPNGKSDDISVGIISINDMFAEVRSLTHSWNYAVGFDAIPRDKLVSILRHVPEFSTNAYRRLELIRMLIKGKRLPEALQLLDSLREDFPGLKAPADQYQLLIREALARQFTAIFEQRSQVGQHRLAANGARLHPRHDLPPETLVRVGQMVDRYDDLEQRIRSIRLALPDMAGSLNDAALRTQAQQAVRVVLDQLDFDSVDRCTAYELIADAADVSPPSKLAMAISGWLMGAEHSVQNLAEALALFEGRLIVKDFLNTNDTEVEERRNLIDRLIKLEGMSADRAAAIIRNAPSPVPVMISTESAGAIGRFQIMETPTSAGAIGFVPPEYHESRQYPVVIAFPGEFANAQNYLLWWQTQAEQTGTIIVIPQLDAKIDYGASMTEHTRFLNFLRQLKLGLRIDDDRVFVAGHGIGGEIAMDMATSHPDLFAGVVSICSLGRRHLQWTAWNAVDVSWYVVIGDSQGGWYERVGILLSKLMKRADDSRKYCDAMIVKYPNRGPESYFEEADDIFAWMDVHRRVRFPEFISADILRSTDLSWWWLQLESIPSQFTKLDEPSRPGDDGFRPSSLKARRTDRKFSVEHLPGNQCSVLLSPEMPDFDIQQPYLITSGRKRVTVNWDPDIRVLMEEYRRTGDRSRLWFMKVTLAD
ncbi:MAG TPA: alpha/beta hydrolase [Planctomycetaceae bacterium]|nr:alpha/beta hydrolase [Planctomycetaceae bacterium]